jgi:hypothetical protein
MQFKVEQLMHSILLGKAVDEVLLMLVDPLYKIARHANVKRAVAATPNYVDGWFFSTSWIPACAGMTLCYSASISIAPP